MAPIPYSKNPHSLVSVLSKARHPLSVLFLVVVMGMASTYAWGGGFLSPQQRILGGYGYYSYGLNRADTKGSIRNDAGFYVGSTRSELNRRLRLENAYEKAFWNSFDREMAAVDADTDGALAKPNKQKTILTNPSRYGPSAKRPTSSATQ